MLSQKNLALRFAGTLFALVTLVHGLRLAIGFTLVVGRFAVPLWINAIGMIVAGGLAAWMFAVSRR